MGIIDWLSSGGVIMGILALTSLLAFAVIMERFNFYTRVQFRLKPFLRELYDSLDVFQTEAAEALCAEHPGPLSKIAMVGLKNWDSPRSELKEILEEAGSREIPVLEEHLGILATIAHASPLLGLLGTVLGIIESFQSYQQAIETLGAAGSGVMAGGLWTALITTAGGLTLGLICYVIHNYLFLRKEKIIADLEFATHEILRIITEKSEGAQRRRT
ncbi:MAG: MotA/TolQ/ExbB proton channel family protein [Planctomycetes bacterium]|nr:MotA/TolQ/ExbB proton channel family protein [Planctomycetota bacterium]